MALVFGILSLMVCSLFGPFAWVYGKRAEEAVDASNGAYGGRDLATAGKILGIVGTVLLIATVVGGVVFVGVLIATEA
jgi:Domain of unknown function (DUF4190)